MADRMKPDQVVRIYRDDNKYYGVYASGYVRSLPKEEYEFIKRRLRLDEIDQHAKTDKETRNMFAAAALTGVMTEGRGAERSYTPKHIAERAFEIADEMMKRVK